jgi:hypothetical protein
MNTGSMLPGHAIITRSTGRIATCECSPDSLRFTWDTREEEHGRHVLAVIWDQGAQHVAKAAVILGAPGDLPAVSAGHNPYRPENQP